MKTISKWGTECKVQMLRKDMSLKDVSEATGLARTYISAIINGRVIVPQETMMKIGDALEVDSALLHVG